MSSLKVTNLQHASAASPAIVLAADGTATAQLSSLNGGALSGARNRIINGDMRIDQRNAGASVTITNTGANTYTLDRWFAYGNNASKFSIQQNAGSVTPPAGFANYLGVTSLAATTVASGDQYILGQAIEGFNAADLAWGTASAATITISFKAYSSLTGTFGGALRNSAGTRSYPFTFSVSAANTWETKSITVAGDTSGTWLTNNGVGLYLYLGLGVGSTYLGTAGAWAGALYTSATGATNVVATNGATFYITGVQLEAGTVATPFERRSYGQELALCQRYYEKTYDLGSVPGTATTNGLQFCTIIISSGNINGSIVFRVSKRAAPTMTYYDSAGTSGRGSYAFTSNNWGTAVPVAGAASNETGATLQTTGAGFGTCPVFVHYTAFAEL